MPNETATLPEDDNIPLEEVVASLRAENEELRDRIFLQGGDLDSQRPNRGAHVRAARGTGRARAQAVPVRGLQGREDGRG